MLIKILIGIVVIIALNIVVPVAVDFDFAGLMVGEVTQEAADIKSRETFDLLTECFEKMQTVSYRAVYTENTDFAGINPGVLIEAIGGEGYEEHSFAVRTETDGSRTALAEYQSGVTAYYTGNSGYIYYPNYDYTGYPGYIEVIMAEPLAHYVLYSEAYDIYPENTDFLKEFCDLNPQVIQHFNGATTVKLTYISADVVLPLFEDKSPEEWGDATYTSTLQGFIYFEIDPEGYLTSYRLKISFMGFNVVRELKFKDIGSDVQIQEPDYIAKCGVSWDEIENWDKDEFYEERRGYEIYENGLRYIYQPEYDWNNPDRRGLAFLGVKFFSL